MGSGASRKSWQRDYYLSSNVFKKSSAGEQFSQVFPVWTIAITSNQLQLAAACSNHRINLWCLVEHKLLTALVGHSDTIWSVAYSPDDALLASAGADGTTRLWEVCSGLQVMILPRNHANWVWCLAWSPDGSSLASGGSDARIMLWNAATAARSAQREGSMREKAASNDTWAQAAAVQAERAAEAAQPLLFWQAHEKSIHALSFASSDPNMLVSVGADCTVAVWNASTGALDCRLCGHLGAINSIAVSPSQEELLATGGEDHTVRLWDLRDLEPGSSMAQQSREKPYGYNLQHFTLKGHVGAVSVVRFCADGRLLASASKDCEVRIWNPDMRNPTLNAKFVAHESWIRDLQWTLDQRYMFTASTDGLIFAWHVPKKYHIKQEPRQKGPEKYET